jgi:hypothetical protein
MTDEQLREAVQEAIARRSGKVPAAAGSAESACGHPSHRLFPVASGDNVGACLIEPAVRCVHCGYCQSYGH